MQARPFFGAMPLVRYAPAYALYAPPVYYYNAPRFAPTAPSGDDERARFYARLHAFRARIRQPIARLPTLGFKELDLWTLYREVTRRRGIDAVIARKQWKEVADALNLPSSCTDSGFRLRLHYKKYLEAYERAYFVPPPIVEAVAHVGAPVVLSPRPRGPARKRRRRAPSTPPTREAAAELPEDSCATATVEPVREKADVDEADAPPSAECASRSRSPSASGNSRRQSMPASPPPASSSDTVSISLSESADTLRSLRGRISKPSEPRCFPDPPTSPAGSSPPRSALPCPTGTESPPKFSAGRTDLSVLGPRALLAYAAHFGLPGCALGEDGGGRGPGDALNLAGQVTAHFASAPAPGPDETTALLRSFVAGLRAKRSRRVAAR